MKKIDMKFRMSMVKVELSVPELRQALESFTQNRFKAMNSLFKMFAVP